MKAWQFRGAHQPLELNDVVEPTPAPTEVLIDIKAAGMCHSDVGFLENEHMVLPPSVVLPMTLGHEIAGVISELGSEVTGWTVGDRVAVVLPTETSDPTVPGLTRDGGYTYKITAPPAALARIPEGVSFEQAAAATDAGATGRNAMIGVGQIRPGMKVGVIGFGGLGQVGTRLAVLEGCEVFVAEIKEDLWPLAQAFGAKAVAKDIREFAEEGLDVVVDFAGFGTTTNAAIEAVRERGRVVQVGLGSTEATISTMQLTFKRVTLVGLLGGTYDDVVAVLDQMAQGHLDLAVTVVDFLQIPEALGRLSRGEVTGRIVAHVEG
jgi:propanol-preferring alcohol dehydrogenase